ncbi:MAG: hypothetical protein NZ869_03030 [Thermoanaerobaculum sp.]|nr:hypothetical protein [Thermoanaerobaculum sp.]MDW7967252.1 hypothetical protein [Thermoanaerobaculum sp.]
MQLQMGGNLSPHVFFRLHVANPNPLFLRDTNVLAGDNGTAEQWRAPDGPVYFSGFPILYDAKGNDVNFSGHWETALGLGVRWWHPQTGEGAEGLVWGFRRTVAQGERIRGTVYRGELELLRG